MAEKTPDEIVAEIDRKQNEEDRDLIPRVGRMIKDKFQKMTGNEPEKEGPYKGTYNPDKKRGELLKDNVSTGEFYPDKKGLFSDTSGADTAKKRASELNKKGAKGMKKGGMVSSASKRADGCATKGKTKGRFV